MPVAALVSLSKTLSHELLILTPEYKWGPVRAEIVIVFDLADERLTGCRGCILPRKLRMISND